MSHGMLRAHLAAHITTLAPGTRLTVRDVTRQFGCASDTAASALRALAQRGVLRDDGWVDASTGSAGIHGPLRLYAVPEVL